MAHESREGSPTSQRFQKIQQSSQPKLGDFCIKMEHEAGQFRIYALVGDGPCRSKKMLPTALQHEKQLKSRTIGIRSSESFHSKQFK